MVDDHPAFRAGLVGLIENEPDMKVVAEAGDGQSALALYRRYQPDAVLMDLRMPGLGGVETILALRKEFPNARVIVVTTYDTDEDVFRAIQAGAKSYVLKDTPLDQIVSTIREVHRGTHRLPAAVANKLECRSMQPELTTRELEVLNLLAQGCADKQIAEILVISRGTVHKHLQNIYEKLDVHSRSKAIARGRALNLV